MKLRKKLLSDARLYLILDTAVAGYSELFDIAEKAVRAGVHVLQLRDKDGVSSDIVKFSRELKKILNNETLYIINDYADMVEECVADGVHLGQEDVSIDEARRVLKPYHLIGLSCQKLEHVINAQEEGADYLGFGSVFKTLTKPDRIPMDLELLKKVVGVAEVPFFAIGGITSGNIDQVIAAGVKRVAVCRDICLAADVEKAVMGFNKKFAVRV